MIFREVEQVLEEQMGDRMVCDRVCLGVASLVSSLVIRVNLLWLMKLLGQEIYDS